MSDQFLKYLLTNENITEAVGYGSWQNMLYLSLSVLVAVFLSIFLAVLNRKKDIKKRFLPLRIVSILILVLYFVFIVLCCFTYQDSVLAFNPLEFVNRLPLFLCSSLHIVIPIASFTKVERVREACFDYIAPFGIVSLIAGTFLATNYYPRSLLNFELNYNVAIHCLIGFCGIYIIASNFVKFKLKNYWITNVILLTVEVLSLIMIKVNLAYPVYRSGGFESNYMFLRHDGGTPFTLITSFVKGNTVLYTLGVIVIYHLILALFYIVINLIVLIVKRISLKKKQALTK